MHPLSACHKERIPNHPVALAARCSAANFGTWWRYQKDLAAFHSLTCLARLLLSSASQVGLCNCTSSSQYVARNATVLLTPSAMAPDAQLVVEDGKVTPLLADKRNQNRWRTEKSHHTSMSIRVLSLKTLMYLMLKLGPLLVLG